MKYIIKNCPALMDGYSKYGKYNGECCDKEVGTKCEYCKDCLLKQIVDKCKDAQCGDYSNDAYSGGLFDMANRILELLDIQEIEE